MRIFTDVRYGTGFVTNKHIGAINILAQFKNIKKINYPSSLFVYLFNHIEELKINN